MLKKISKVTILNIYLNKLLIRVDIMEDDFINRFFEDLTSEIDNSEYVNALKEEICEINEEKIEKIIKKHF